MNCFQPKFHYTIKNQMVGVKFSGSDYVTVKVKRHFGQNELLWNSGSSLICMHTHGADVLRWTRHGHLPGRKQKQKSLQLDKYTKLDFGHACWYFGSGTFCATQLSFISLVDLECSCQWLNGKYQDDEQLVVWYGSEMKRSWPDKEIEGHLPEQTKSNRYCGQTAFPLGLGFETGEPMCSVYCNICRAHVFNLL